MGSKISPTLSNIFLTILETKIIDENLKNGTLLAYKRYVDDFFSKPDGALLISRRRTLTKHLCLNQFKAKLTEN